MPGRHELNQESVVEDLVDDAVVPGADPVGVRLADQGDAPGRPRVLGEQVDRRTHSLLVLAGERRDRFPRPAGDALPSAQPETSPSIALDQ